MKKKFSQGFAVAKVLIILVIIGVCASVYYRDYSKKMKIKADAEFGLNIPPAVDGQVYQTKASDREVFEVIAMPFKCPGDEDNALTDRRVLLKVKNEKVLEVGIWFVRSNDNKENIIPSPITRTNLPPESFSYRRITK